MAEISYEKLLESLFDGVYFVDLSRRILIWNKGAERITGYSREEVIGTSCGENILRHVDGGGCEKCTGGCDLAATLLDGKVREATLFLHHKLGHRVPVSVRISPVRDDAGKIIGGIEVFTDNSNALQILQELERYKEEAYIDALTKVGNRRYGEMTLDTRLYEWRTHATPVGVIFLDIDHFKNFNDTFGHQAGDAVLTMVGKSVSNTLRRWDALVRWGGEEFVVILNDVSPELLAEIAERIRVIIASSFLMLGGEKVEVTASLGGTLAVAGDTPEAIIARADRLMYASKGRGRNVVTLG
ncbi:MAG: diguanylate cyclase [Desulfuromonadales bacterium GWD2_61_12]|nr:MAG: diguanylate cyclase [Desulfuromonadales bacterium GWC2_61_20]OGR33094.1 MAG: diguanylate cyclase [Desulfuromonadales bacterium GWD2_61_12]HAD04690.1 sensor domain-containing diguanylate cyclase [Desulfuromonas sp.]